MVRTDRRHGGSVGRGREGRRTNDEAGIRAVELHPDFKTIQVCLVESIKDILDGHKMIKYIIFTTRLVHG